MGPITGAEVGESVSEEHLLSTVKVQVLENTVNSNSNILTADYLHCWKYAHFFLVEFTWYQLIGAGASQTANCDQAILQSSLLPNYMSFIFVHIYKL